MPSIKIKWDFGFRVDDGARVVLSSPALEVDAYDVVKVSIPKSGGTASILLQPATGTDKVSFVTISANHYGSTLTYTVDPDATVRKLDAPQILVGKGSVAFLNSTGNPKQVDFTNGLAEDVDLQIVVGRGKS